MTRGMMFPEDFDYQNCPDCGKIWKECSCDDEVEDKIINNDKEL